MAEANPVIEAQHTCAECNEVVQPDQRSTLAPCDHIFHTDCFTQILINLMPRHRRCRICNEDIVQLPPNNLDDAEDTFAERREKKYIRGLWDRNRDFRNDLKNYMKIIRLQKKDAVALKRVVAQKKNEINQQWTLLKNQMQALYDEAKGAVLATNEYKQHKKTSAKHVRARRELLERYHVNSMWMLQQALRDKPGMRRIPTSFHVRPAYFILRGFRFRLKA